ncbi:hypothetical protein LTR27_009909 [Elasticomyces elasticus]|nr:hypothetical protein LTR27_009909 [Elasticomyces elasticus]
MANKGLYGGLMLLAGIMIALLPMCCVWSAHDGNEVLADYLSYPKPNTASMIRSGQYSQISFECDAEQLHWHNEFPHTPSEYLTNLLQKPSEELSVASRFSDCRVIAALITFFGSENSYEIKRSDTPALRHHKLFLFAEEYSFHDLALQASFLLRKDSETSWQQSGFAKIVPDAYASKTSIGRRLRSDLVDLAAKHHTTLFGSDEDQSFNKSLALGGKEFAVDVSQARALRRSQYLSS